MERSPRSNKVEENNNTPAKRGRKCLQDRGKGPTTPLFMKIVSWNINALNDSLKQKEIYKLIKESNKDVIGIIENKVKVSNISKVMSTCLPH